MAQARAVSVIAEEIHHVDLLEGRSCVTTLPFAKASASEQAAYQGDARAAIRRRDVVAMAVAKHKAVQAAEAVLTATSSPLITLGKETLKAVIGAALEAHHAHLSAHDDARELREYEALIGVPVKRHFTVHDGGKDAPYARGTYQPRAGSLDWAEREASDYNGEEL